MYSSIVRKKKKTTKFDKKTVKYGVRAIQCEDGTVKRKKRNKKITKCDKKTTICDVGIIKCEDEIVKCKKKRIREPLNMTKKLLNVMLELHSVRWNCQMW